MGYFKRHTTFAARRSIGAQLGAGDAQFGAKSAQLGATDLCNAALTLAAAAAEPPALWERSRVRVDVASAQAVLHDLEAELSKLITIDILGHQLRDSPMAWPQFEATLRDIERRIGALCGTKASES